MSLSAGDADRIVARNRVAWDRQVEQGNEWSLPVGPEVIAAARRGEWSVVLIGHTPTPRAWFPEDLTGVRILALASGGGQQGPVLAAAGADVTVFDNSPNQLGREREVAERDGLTIRTELGDMRDLSRFAGGSFDLVLHPVSNVFCPEILPVWRECYRVLQPGGSLLVGFMNPDIFVFDDAAAERGDLVVRHPLPFVQATDITDDERTALGPEHPWEFSHTLAEQIGGQLAAGFVITAFDEAPHDGHLSGRYMPGYFATKAVRPGA